MPAYPNAWRVFGSKAKAVWRLPFRKPAIAVLVVLAAYGLGWPTVEPFFIEAGMGHGDSCGSAAARLFTSEARIVCDLKSAIVEVQDGKTPSDGKLSGYPIVANEIEGLVVLHPGGWAGRQAGDSRDRLIGYMDHIIGLTFTGEDEWVTEEGQPKPVQCPSEPARKSALVGALPPGTPVVVYSTYDAVEFWKTLVKEHILPSLPEQPRVKTDRYARQAAAIAIHDPCKGYLR